VILPIDGHDKRGLVEAHLAGCWSPRRHRLGIIVERLCLVFSLDA